jgi:hypothetical protein
MLALFTNIRSNFSLLTFDIDVTGGHSAKDVYPVDVLIQAFVLNSISTWTDPPPRVENPYRARKPGECLCKSVKVEPVKKVVLEKMLFVNARFKQSAVEVGQVHEQS